MSRIGILTFHRCINYGSYWQARCLLEGLRARGHDAVLLDHDSARVNRAEWRCALSPLLPARMPGDYPSYGAKVRRFMEAIEDLPRSPRFDLDRPSDMESRDLVLVGSDEVWNLHHPWYGGQRLFFGEGLRAGRIAAYAASFGSYDAAEGLSPWWSAAFRHFAAISVRDENSRRLVRHAARRDAELALDPCLLFPPGPVPGGTAGEVEAGPYIAIYGHSFPRWFADAVRAVAAARRWRLVSIGYRNDWADAQRLSAGPLEFARLMAGPRAVATNFFHGCVFALLNAKPFACVPSAYRANKVRDLTGLLGLEGHLVDARTGPARIGRLMEAPLRPAAGRRIVALRRRSAAYLDRVLG